MRGRGEAGAVLAAAVLAGAAVALAEDPKPRAAQEPVAVVGGTPIAAAELDALVAGHLAELRIREHTLRSQALDELVARVLLAKEAAARGVSVLALERTEIHDKSAVTEAEARGFYDANRGRFGTTAEPEALRQIQAGLAQQRQRERRAALARELRAQYGVKVLLEPLRFPVEPRDAPLRGNPSAPVTIVEFSDFQCPFCVRARPTVNRVREVYRERVRIAFRHFPLDFHPQARKAAEAAACAREQGKFWEMHDRLFAAEGRLEVTDLKAHAVALGLDATPFNQCLDSGRHAGTVERDTEEGARFGVTGTPAFFVNGRPIVGAQPFEVLAQVIDDELERSGMAHPAAEASR